MKMIVSIVSSSEARGLTDELMRQGYRATEISTTGGFLRRRNVTLLIGVEDEEVDDVFKIIHDTCHERTEHGYPSPPVIGTLLPPAVDTQVSGAVIFVLDVDRVESY